MTDTMPTEIGRVKINNIWYRRPVIRVASIEIDGSKCIVPVGDLMAMIDDGQEYKVQIKTMRPKEFENLPEFGGW